MRGFCLSVALILGFMSVPAFASVVTVTGKTTAQADPEKAKESCIQEATRRGVEIFVDELLSKPTAQENYSKLQPAIYKPFRDFITTYELIDFSQEAGTPTCQVKVEINDIRIKSQLQAIGLTPGKGSHGKVMVVASEMFSRDRYYYGFYYALYHHGNYDLGQCEGAIIDALAGSGVSVMDTMFNDEELTKMKQVGSRYDKYGPSPDQLPIGVAAELAKAADPSVEFVVSCKASANDAGKTTKHFTSVTATANCIVSNVIKRAALGSVRAQATKLHIDPHTAAADALTEACRQAGSQVVAKLK